jgi:uncharacterized protein (TIGR00369 family)
MDIAQRAYGVATREDIGGLSGIELLRAMIAGRLPAPPMAGWLRFGLVEVGEGRAVFEGEPDVQFLNPMGIIHGGWALALIDSATGCAAHTLLEAGAGYTTVETRANFNRPIMPDTGLVRAEGTVISRGRRIITAEARVIDATGKLLAHGGSTLMVL